VRAVRSTANRCGEGQRGLEDPTGPPPMKLARPREIAPPFLTRLANEPGNYRRSRASKALTVCGRAGQKIRQETDEEEDYDREQH
jgi:hypothetical protein